MSKTITLSQQQSNTKPRQGSQNKENKLFKSMNNTMQQTSQATMIQQVFQMLQEIKTQNQYLIERNSELEYMIERDLKLKLEEGLSDLKSEIQGLKKQSQKQSVQVKRFRFINSNVQQKRKRFYSSRQVYQREEQLPQEQELQQIPEDQYRIPSEDEPESTFMRKLDETVPPVKSTLEENPDEMRMSLGANLLQMMQFASKQNNQNKRRNFNFRCNLQEIDKIIEEDVQEGTKESSNPDFIKEENILEETMDDRSIQATKLPQNDDASLERPKTGQTQNLTKSNQRPPRKQWGFNPRKSLRGTRKASKEGRPKTAQAGGLRMNRGLIAKKESEDPILALLREEDTDSEKAENTPQPQIEQVCENQVQESLSAPILKEEPLKEDSPQKQEPINFITPEVSNQTTIKEQEEEIQIIPPRRAQQPQRRGMFKAPPPNLIESLLQDDEEEKTPLQNVLKDQTNEPVNQPVKINNFLRKSRQASRSRSKKRVISKQQFNAFNIYDDEEDDADDGGENPFQSTTTLLNNDGNSVNEQDQMSQNLFFKNKEEGEKSDTAKFGNKAFFKQ